jgi:peptide deformylase
MPPREIRLLGDPVLRRTAQPVAEVTDETRSLITDLFDTMYAEDGVGLAAPQVGVMQRVIVVDPRQEDVAPFALVNPVVLERSSEVERAEEGCLSIPGLQEVVERPARITITGLDADGAEVSLHADGLLARVLQHEVDHLDGVLFIDRVSPLKRKLLIDKWKKLHR